MGRARPLRLRPPRAVTLLQGFTPRVVTLSPCPRAYRGGRPARAGATKEVPAMLQTAPAMPLMDAIERRRSVRSYLPDPVDDATVRQLLAAAVRAPTAIHEEPWAF